MYLGGDWNGHIGNDHGGDDIHIVRGGEIVQGDEGPVGGVAQVVCHGVKVVGVHREEGQEE